MFERGIPMVLGTDGLGSAPDLDLFAEMAACRNLYPELPPTVILEMATLNAARALRVDSVLGSFEPNKLGRFLVYSGDLGNDPAEALVSGIDRDKLEWAGGEIDMRP
jgi:5-methylthioadenosine/S-adenosylhomocysteine deaminase